MVETAGARQGPAAISEREVALISTEVPSKALAAKNYRQACRLGLVS